MTASKQSADCPCNEINCTWNQIHQFKMTHYKQLVLENIFAVVAVFEF